MKKIVIGLAIAVAAFASQAASINWQYSSSSATDKNAHIYLVVGNSAPTSIDDWSTWIDSQTTVSDKKVTYSALTKKASASAEATSDAITKDKSYFFVMVDEAGENFKATSVLSGANIVYDTAAQESQLTTDLASSFGDWTAFGGGTTEPEQPGTGDVPEPTSGLLLVLGAAGLALRRRRA